MLVTRRGLNPVYDPMPLSPALQPPCYSILGSPHSSANAPQSCPAASCYSRLGSPHSSDSAPQFCPATPTAIPVLGILLMDLSVHAIPVPTWSPSPPLFAYVFGTVFLNQIRWFALCCALSPLAVGSCSTAVPLALGQGCGPVWGAARVSLSVFSAPVRAVGLGWGSAASSLTIAVGNFSPPSSYESSFSHSLPERFSITCLP
ncbi:unnamed protein product [Caretta caretta]